MNTSSRKRRLMQLGAVLAGAILLVVVAIIVSGGGHKASDRPAAAEKAGGAIPGQREAAAMLQGIPQQGIYLGQPNAPVRLVELADLQCPICREYTLQTLPVLVQDYVRTGKVRMELRDWPILGDDSVKAARFAAGAAAQDRLWNFADVFYYNQGDEGSGYVTPPFLARIAKASGVDAAAATRLAATNAAVVPLKASNTIANRYGVDGTPTILLGKRGGGLAKVNLDPVDVAGFKQAIDGLLGQA
jgi:protein-disulfide isomerase